MHKQYAECLSKRCASAQLNSYSLSFMTVMQCHREAHFFMVLVLAYRPNLVSNGFHIIGNWKLESASTIAHKQVALVNSRKTMRPDRFCTIAARNHSALPRLRVFWRLMPSISLTKQLDGTSLGHVSISYRVSLLSMQRGVASAPWQVG